MGGAVPLLPNTPSWRGTQGEHRDNFTFTDSVQYLSTRGLAGNSELVLD
jgi:hypothetical protein